MKKNGLKARILTTLLAAAMLVSLPILSGAEELDLFTLIQPDLKGGNTLETGETLIQFRPGQQIQILIEKAGLKSSRGVGAVRWFFKLYSSTALLLIGETSFYQETVTQPTWKFHREIPYFIPESFTAGTYRLEIYLEDMIGGTYYADSESFSLAEPARKETAAAEATPAETPGANPGYRLSLDSVEIEVIETSQKDSTLTVSILFTNNGSQVWIGILDAAFANESGSYFKAVKTGIIQSDGWGGVDLASGEKKVVKIAFDTGRFIINRIRALDIYFRGKERGRMEEIPVPWSAGAN